MLTMFITVKYLHCRHKCNFMVCHFQPSCSQRTSASTLPPPPSPLPPLQTTLLPHLAGYLLYYEQNIYELILIFLLLQMQSSMCCNPRQGTRRNSIVVELGAATWPDDKQVSRHIVCCAISTFPIFWSRNLLRHFQYKL